MLDNLKCKLGIHSWKRVGITKPIRRVSEFVDREYMGHYAAGECTICGVLRLREVTGYWRWYHTDEVTKKQYQEKFASGSYKLE